MASQCGLCLDRRPNVYCSGGASADFAADTLHTAFVWSAQQASGQLASLQQAFTYGHLHAQAA